MGQNKQLTEKLINRTDKSTVALKAQNTATSPIKQHRSELKKAAKRQNY